MNTQCSKHVNTYIPGNMLNLKKIQEYIPFFLNSRSVI